MQTVCLDQFKISIDRQGADRYAKASYPVRYGRYGEVKTADYLFEFNQSNIRIIPSIRATFGKQRGGQIYPNRTDE